MRHEQNIDTLFSRELDAIAEEKNYIVEARQRLESEFTTSPPKSERFQYRYLWVASGAAAAAAVALFFWLYRHPGELTAQAQLEGRERQVYTGSWLSSSELKGIDLSFSDGSFIALERNTELRVQDLKPNGAHLLLERGNIDVSVVPKKKKNWKIDAGPYRIYVTGTRFDVEWIPDQKRFIVDLHEGSVKVDGPLLEKGKRLSRGERMTVSLDNRIAEISKRDRLERIVSREFISSEETVDSQGGADDEEGSDGFDGERRNRGQRRHSVIRTKKPAWRTLAKKGDYAAAVELLNGEEIQKVISKGTIGDLMLLGDSARLSRHPRMALNIYKAVRSRFPQTPASQRAAFSLGRIALEQYNDPAKAAKWFRTCYQENQNGTMAREAAGRLMEALDRAGNKSAARDVATSYVSRFPGGPHTKLAQKLLTD